MKYFYLFFIILFLSVMIIFSHNPIHSVLSLIGCVFNIIILLFSLEFDFLSYILLLVYIGAVLILFLFVVKMIDINFLHRYTLSSQLYPLYFLIFITKLWFLFHSYSKINLVTLDVFSNSWISNFIHFTIHDLILFSAVLYTHFFFYTLITALILLVSMLGSIALCLSSRNK